MTMRISVAREDVLMFPCDILLLKYAEVNRGADLAVADALGKAALSVKKGKHEFFGVETELERPNYSFWASGL